MKFTTSPSLEDVLNAFSVEPDNGRSALERYLRDFPQYGAELVELSRELSRPAHSDDAALSDDDLKFIDASWNRHRASVPLADPLAELLPNAQRELAQKLGVPRQVIAAFRERKVLAGSIPRKFLRQFAAAINHTAEELANTLAAPADAVASRSYRADAKPDSQKSISFEQLLIDAGVPDETRAALMDDGD